MALYFITLTLLIAAVLGIRAVFRNTVSPGLIYALWIAAVIRLCLPISLIEADFLTVLTETDRNTEKIETVLPDEMDIGKELSSEIVLPEIEYTVPEYQIPAVTPPSAAVTVPEPSQPVLPEIPLPEQTVERESEELTGTEIISDTSEEETSHMNFRKLFLIVWLSGAAVMAVWFTVSGGIFRYRLCRDRRLYGRFGRTKVYVSSSVGAPCLSGLIPCIYITDEVAENPSRDLVILHERTHLRHLDHLWSAVRVAAVCVHWFNPLVWTAAFLSKQDAELACDDSVCSRLSGEKRLEYARVLIDTIPQKHRYATGLGSAPMKQRILRLTKRQKNHLICAFLAAVLIFTAVGCSFVGLRRLTYDNIMEQKGFTILSQELRAVEIKLPMNELPEYAELESKLPGTYWDSEDITVFEEGMSKIVPVSIGIAGEDKVFIEFDIVHDLLEEGRMIKVSRVLRNGKETTYCPEFYVLDRTITDDSAVYEDAFMERGCGSGNQFSIYMDAVIYEVLTGTASFSVILTELEYARGDEVREYSAEIFTEEKVKELLGKEHDLTADEYSEEIDELSEEEPAAVLPAEDIVVVDTPASNDDLSLESPVNISYRNTERAVNTVLLPLSGTNPGYYIYTYGSEHTILLTYDLVKDRSGVNLYRDTKIIVVDTRQGKVVHEEAFINMYELPMIAYGYNCCYLYKAGIRYEKAPEDEYPTETYTTDYVYKIDFTGGNITVTDAADEFDWYSRGEQIVFAPDGITAALTTEDSQWNDGGLDICRADGTVERILDSVYWNGETVTDINDVIGYNPIGFLDDTHLVYSIGGWEWSRGYGIYDIASGEKTEYDTPYRIFGVHDGAFYAAYENDGKSDYGVSKMEIRKITPDGKETLIAATHDVPEGVYPLSMDKYVDFKKGVWVIYETGEIGGFSSSSIPEDGIMGATVMSADFSTVLLEFDFVFDWNFLSKMTVTDDAVTFVYPVVYESAPSAAETVTDVIYRCDDVYILEDTPIHGEFTVTFPDGTGDYRIRDCKVLLCEDGCDLTDVVSRALWGYAPAYRIDQYEEFESGDGWKYGGRQYFNIVPEDMAAEMISQMTAGGVPEHEIAERLGERRYIWLLDLGDSRYLFTVLEVKDYRTVMPENEHELAADIMKSAVVELHERELTALERFRDQNPAYFENAYPQFTVRYSHELADGTALIYFSRGGLPHGQSEAHFCHVKPDGSYTDLLADEDNKTIIRDSSLNFTSAAGMSNFRLNNEETKLKFTAEWIPTGTDKESWEKWIELDLETGKMKETVGGEILWSYSLSDAYQLHYTVSENGEYAICGESGGSIYRLTDITSGMMLHGSDEMLPTVLPIYSSRTDSGYEFCIGYRYASPFYRYCLIAIAEENGRLLYRGIEDIDERTVTEHPAYEEKTVTVTSLAELQDYNSRHIFSDSLYAFYYDLLSGNSRIPEYNTVKISNFEITFSIPAQLTTYFTFTVESSGLDTLPPGEYYREVKDLLDVTMIDPNADDGIPFYDVPEVQKLYHFLSGCFIWNTPTYGEGTEYPGIHNYICCYHGDGADGLPYDDYRKIAAAEFGVTDFYSRNNGFRSG